MPFYELVAGQTLEKQNVEMTQLRAAPPGASPRKTWFIVNGAFWWSTDAIAPPRSFENVPAQLQTDLASVPRFMWGVVASYGRHTLPALLHDHGCDLAKAAGGQRHWMRREADRRFRQNLRQFAAMGLGTRWLMWTAVRLFGFWPVGVVTALAALLGCVLAVWSRAGGDSWECLGWTITFGLAALVELGLAVALLVLVLWLSYEVESGEGPGVSVLPGIVSILGAVAIGSIAVGPLLPLVGVTLLTNLALSLLNLVTFLLGLVFVPIWNLLTTLIGLTPLAAMEDVESIQAERAPERPPFNLFPGP